jgi:hypothetical protein
MVYVNRQPGEYYQDFLGSSVCFAASKIYDPTLGSIHHINGSGPLGSWCSRIRII